MSDTVQPGTADELADVVRNAIAKRHRLRVRGAGGWMRAGHAVRADTTLALDAFRGVREYTPEDLTIGVGAATTLAELDAATRPHGQWCPLLPWGDDAGTVGATIATASVGPFAGALGRPRELVLGLSCVDGRGRRIEAGGRVVKNVAGFDLTRLMTGQWGTLGVIAGVHLRLRARPAVDESFALAVPPERDAALSAVCRGVHAPLAAVPVPADAQALRESGGVARDVRWLIRIGGNAAFVRAARAAFAALGRLDPLPPTVWDVVRRECAPPERARRWRWDDLSRRLKAAFDPHGVLNPGLLGDEASPP